MWKDLYSGLNTDMKFCDLQSISYNRPNNYTWQVWFNKCFKRHYEEVEKKISKFVDISCEAFLGPILGVVLFLIYISFICQTVTSNL